MYKLFTILMISIGVIGVAKESDTIVMNKVLQRYLAIQSSLANDSTLQITENSEAIQHLVQELSSAKLKKAIQVSAKALQSSESIGSMREAFKKLSIPMVDWARGTKPSQINIVYCPMAKARWLQNGVTIKNPYYGKQMSSCGEIEN